MYGRVHFILGIDEQENYKEQESMAQYNTLPIYKSCYDFLLRMMHVVTNFPKDYKYSLGEKIQTTSLETVICIYRANILKYKSQHLKSMLYHIQMLYLYLRIAHDIKILPQERYASIILMHDDISRQAQGWLNASNKITKEDETEKTTASAKG